MLEPGNITALFNYGLANVPYIGNATNPFNYGLANVPYIGNATNPYLPVLVTNEPAPEMMPEAAPAPAPAPAPDLAGKPSVLVCSAY